MAEAIRAGRPHRASAELAYHVLEVLGALAAGEPGTIEIESRCDRPAPLPLPGGQSPQRSDRPMVGAERR
jgi:hypothetical protein